MVSNNINQLLLRNIDALAAQAPLFVNIEADQFFAQYVIDNPDSNLDCYYTNFALHTRCQQLTSTNIRSHFCAHYQSEQKHDLVVLNFPKSKAEFGFTLAMLATTVTEEAMIVIVGENKSGIKSCDKLAKSYLTHCNKVDAARHCLLYVGKYQQDIPSFDLEKYYTFYDITIDNKTLKVAALPGVFSQKSLDIGTRVLLENLPTPITGSLLDFGCGAGVIAAYVGLLNPATSLTLVDVSALALQSAQKTLLLNNLSGDTIASDSLSMVTGSYDFVVSNPPFHQGIKTHYAATETFLSEIKQHINLSGNISIVANSFLQYQPIMEKSIGKTQVLCRKNGFTIYTCTLSK